MSFTSDYLEQEKKKKKKYSTGDSFTDSFLEYEEKEIAEMEANKKAEKESKAAWRAQIADAPVRETEDTRKWFQKGAFEDGYQFGDIVKSITSTGQDLEENVMAGILGMGESVVDAGAYLVGGVGGLFSDKFKDKTQEFIAKDLYDEKEVAKKIVGARNIASLWTDTDKDSLIGEKTEGLAQSGGQLLGTMALQSVGVPWFVTTGVTSFGGEVENAFNQGATYGDAGVSGLVTAGAEILTEKISGGISFGGGTLDDVLTNKLVTGISNKAIRTMAKFGMDVVGEGSEEIVSQIISNLGTSLYREENLNDILFSEEAIDQYLESFIGGAVLGGVSSGTRVVDSVVTSRDFTSGLTENEEKVFKKVYEDRVAEAEQGGKKLTTKEKNKIYDEVMKDLESGYIDTDTIEEVLGGEAYQSYRDTIDSEDALQKEFDELGNLKKSDFTAKQDDRYNELKQMLAEMKAGNTRNQLKTELSEKVFGLTKGSKLSESYNEKARRSQAFEADLSQYDAKTQGTVKKAVESGILNNTRRTHQFVDIVAKISADKGVLFDFTNNAKLKESGFAVDGKEVNGYVTKDGITLNMDSHKAWQTTVGHEITHVLEGTELYTEMQKALFDYAKSKNDYQGRYDTLKEIYKSVEGANIDAELTADLVGDYLFTDSDFVNNLSVKHRNVFQKIYDEIKYLLKVATAGSKEARELEKVKRAFEKAFKEGGKASEGTKYSISADPQKADAQNNGAEYNGKEFWLAVADLNGNIVKTWTYDEAEAIGFDAEYEVLFDEKLKDGYRFFSTDLIEDNGRIEFDDHGDRMPDDMIERINEQIVVKQFTNKDTLAENIRKIHSELGSTRKTMNNIIPHISGVKMLWEQVANNEITGSQYNEFLRKDSYFKKLDDKATELQKEFDSLVEELEKLEGKEWKELRSSVLYGGSPKYSLTDSDGKTLTKEQGEYFKDSKMRDENGNLKVMYHGSQDAGFHVFDPAHSDDETSLFFVDRNDVAASYSGTTETYEAQSIRTAEDMNNFIEKIGAEGYEVVEENGKFTLLYEGDRVADSNTAKGIYEEFCWYEGVGEGDANYKVYLNLTNPLEVDAEGRNWNNVSREFSQELADRYNSLTEDEKDALVNLASWEDIGIFRDELRQALADTETGTPGSYDVDFARNVRSAYEKLGGNKVNMYDLFTIASDGFSAESINQFAVKQMNTRDYAQRAKEQGYDGVIFKNIVDVGGYSNGSEGASTVAIAFDSNQIKSVANDKPTRNADIRYSLSEDSDNVATLDGGSVSKYSLSTWTPDTQEKVRDNLIKAGYESDRVDKWIKDTNGVASVIAADRDRLDFEAADNQVMLKDNQEYIKTLDASTLCAKRLVYQGTFDAIQHRMPNTMLSSDDLIDLLNMMKEHGVQTPCGVCYVESRRRHLGKFAQDWLNNYKGEYKPNLDEVTTSDGLEALRKSHPQTYQDFVDAMNKKGSSNPKVVQLRTEYRNEIMSLTPSQIRKIEAIGGLRVQSFSDFETPHMLDMMQAVMDMSAKGLHSQAYTKVPNFAWVFGDTGIKINLSLIAEGNGFDADGNLAFSSTEGMDIDEAMRLRDAYSHNVGTIIVGANDKHILACMADDRIDFIIPFHRSGWGMRELDMMGMSSYTDYSYGQNEHDLNKPAKVVNGVQQYAGLENLYPIDYWDYSLTGKENAERYLNLCAKTGREPKFSKFLVNNGDGSYSLQPDGSTDGYWKTLIDFKMYDNEGRGAAQQKVQPIFNMDEAYRVLNEYEGGANSLPVANDVVEEFVAKYQSYEELAPAMSLSAKGEAPARRGTPLRDLRLETEDVAPIREDVSKTENTTPTVSNMEQVEDYAPISEEEANALQSERVESLDDADAPPEMEAPYYGESEDAAPSDPFENRDIKEVGNRKVKAYMYENPEVKPFFQKEANIMLGELGRTTKGERMYIPEGLPGSYGAESYGHYTGVKRHTSPDIEYLLDSLGYSYAEIEKGLNAIIEDDGAENNACSKRIEFLLNDRLLNGYQDDQGYPIPADQDYINLLNEKQITEYSDEARKQFFEVADEYAPLADDDIAPVVEAYEAIKPKRERKQNKEPRLKRVDSANAGADGKTRKWAKTSTESEAVDGKILLEDLDQKSIHYEPISNKTTLGKANAKLNGMGYESSVTYFNSQFSNKNVSLEDIALGERLIQEAIKRGDTKTAGELIQDVSILGTELGQKVQALSIIKRLTPEGQLRMLQKTVERGKTKGDKSFEGVEITQEMIDHILKTYGKDGSYDQSKLNEAVEDVKKKIADQMKVATGEKANAWRYLSMLGNPKTHIRNLVSNVAMRGTVAVKNAVARSIESIAPIGNRTKTWESASTEVKDFADKTTAEMKDVLSDGGKYNEEASIKGKRQIFKNKILNGIYEFNSDLLTKEDWWFSKSAFTNSLSEYLTANGIRTEQDIKDNPKIVEKAKKYATEQAQIATFRQYSWLANKINEIERKNAATNIAVGAVLPFKKTPINIAKTALNYSPLGFAKTLTYDAKQVKEGNMESSEMIDHLAQNITGSALTLVGYMLASAGFLNGAGEEDKEGKYDYQLGEQAYSVNIGGATYSLSWLSPIAMPLFVGANAYEQLVEGKEWNGDVVLETLAKTLDPLSEMSFLSSLDSVLSSYDSGIEKFAGIGQSALQNYITQYVPTLSSQFASVLDDKKRTTKVAGDSDFKFVDETINNLKYKIPFLRETLEPTTDIWGNEVNQTENALTRAFETFIAPYAKRENIATKIDEEIKEVYGQTGDDGLIPSIPYNYINYGGEKYEMSAEEYTDYKKTYGQLAYDLMEELFDTETYKNATSEEKAELINSVYDYARDEAKREYFDNNGIDFTNAESEGKKYYKENAIKGAIENDMTPDEYQFSVESPEKYKFLNDNGVTYDDYKNGSEEFKDAYSWAFKNPEKYTMSKAVSDDLVTYRKYAGELYDIKADKDEDGKSITGSRKEKVIDYVNNLDIDYGARLILFKNEYNADDTYNYEIIDYLNSREDISYEQMETILKELGFTVDAQGNISW